MRRMTIFLFILLLASCGQLSYYDEITQSLNIDLPRPLSVDAGMLSKELPKDYENFDLIFTFSDEIDILGKDFWVELGDEERYEIIGCLYALYQLEGGTTTEEKRRRLEDYLSVDLGQGAKAYHGLIHKEHIFLLPRSHSNEIFMLRVVD